MKQLILSLLVCFGMTPMARAGVVEDPVDLARAWLVRHQDPKTGLWSAKGGAGDCSCGVEGEARHDPGVSGLALLALLGEPGEHEDDIRAAVTGLIGIQKAGKFGVSGSHDYIYTHAVCVWALCEAMDKASIDWEECRNAVQLGVDLIVRARSKRSGWRYSLSGAEGVDSSVTTWCVLALVAARRAGFEVSDKDLLGGARVFRDYQDAEVGRIGYDDVGTTSSRITGVNDNHAVKYAEALTAASLHALGAIGMTSRDDRRWGRSFDLMERTPPVWRQRFGTDNYYLMHGAAALEYIDPGGKGAWRVAMRDVILPKQVRKSGCQEGSWDPLGPWCFAGGRVYTTAMLVLALEPLTTPSVEVKSTASASTTFEGAPGVGLLSDKQRRSAKRSGKSKRMVKDGLEWLARHQAEDGSWCDKELALLCDPKDKEGGCAPYGGDASLFCTSIGLLAFLGEGHHPGVNGPHRETVERALSFLMSEYLPPDPEEAKVSADEYYAGLTERVFPVLALVEAAASIKDPKVEWAAKKGAESLLAMRLDDGGWPWGFGRAFNYTSREYYPEGGACEPTAMAVVTLLRAERVGLLEVPDGLMQDAMSLVGGHWMTDGSRAISSAQRPRPIPILWNSGSVLTRGDAPTAAALLVERLATGEAPKLNKACEAHLLKLVPAKKNADDDSDLFAWFLTDLATHPNKKGLGREMSRAVEVALEELQLSKGCIDGSWNALCARNHSGSKGWGGRVYTTSIAILCLQTPLWGEALFGD